MVSAITERWQHQLELAGPAAVTVGVMGDPVTHSLSPRLHMAAFDALGIDGRSLPFTVGYADAPDAVTAMRTLGFRGLSVTMPLKETVMVLADAVSDTAARLAATNCLVNHDGHLSAHSTDGDGFVRSLREEFAWDPSGKRVVVVGAGGAARAVIEAVGRADAAEVVVLNRSPERARVAVAVGGPHARVGTDDDLVAADLVVNATPVGMAQQPGLPTPVRDFRAGQMVVDLIYQPLTTEWVRAATEAKAIVTNGVPMLLHQAALQIELWTGLPAPVEAMRAAVVDSLTLPEGAQD